jgi:hypothetical protein
MKTAKAVTFEILDGMEPGQTFSGALLENMVRTETHQMHYPATMLRYMREYRRLRGRSIRCINKPKSVYEVGKHGN